MEAGQAAINALKSTIISETHEMFVLEGMAGPLHKPAGRQQLSGGQLWNLQIDLSLCICQAWTVCLTVRMQCCFMSYSLSASCNGRYLHCVLQVCRSAALELF